MDTLEHRSEALGPSSSGRHSRVSALVGIATLLGLLGLVVLTRIPANRSGTLTAVHYGTFDPSIPMDENARAFQAFLDARMEGSGAEEWLTSQDKDFFDRDGGLYSSYYGNYSVSHRNGPDTSGRYVYEVFAQVNPQSIITDNDISKIGFNWTDTFGPGQNYKGETLTAVLLNEERIQA